ncbi:hypothetical protein ABZ399_16340 [Micromonospora aurantiaca]|uniref:hypothetical protein n=1 Tax=Micromonospora aurantiaca (nom. illeg.) TaxID=47850 RepID=UPI0033E91A11
MSTATAGADAAADAEADATLVGVADSDADGLDSLACSHPAAAMARTAKTTTDFRMFFTVVPIKDDFRYNQHACNCRNSSGQSHGTLVPQRYGRSWQPQQVERVAKSRLFGAARLVCRLIVGRWPTTPGSPGRPEL